MRHIVCVVAVLMLCQHRAVADSRSYQKGYVRIRSELMQRDVAVHKIVPGAKLYGNSTKDMSCSILIIDVLDIDEINQMMAVVIYLDFCWHIEELSWNASDYHDVKEVYLDKDSLWTPNLVVAIGDQTSLRIEIPGKVKIWSDGKICMQNHQHISFRCNIEFLKYPFDTQKCGFGVFKMDFEAPNITMEPNNFSVKGVYDMHGEWALVNHSLSTVVNPQIDEFPRFDITVRRQYIYYVITIILPMVLTSLLVPLVFLIPARSGEKVAYIVAIFTSCAIFLSMIR
ncbi:acetylcholine receptor subunit delta-like [Physella acuta]|uniref:acetylcholine receptor subunit delta-like n=1 Tax=Physella acuta TaxID=109671 RepID=UPI0027DC0912|nr:acetylcholine receptor subunit delta-like [Physella acuta]